RGFGILDENIEISILVENTGIEQLELALQGAALLVLLDQATVRKFSLWIFVEEFHVRMRRSRIQIEIVFLYILTMVPLVWCQPEEPLLQYRIAPIPERPTKNQQLVPIAETGDGILAPAKCFRARQIMREKSPRIPIGAVILPHRPPRSRRSIR